VKSQENVVFISKEKKMRISRSTGYGILAVGYIAKHQNQPIILSQSIAKEYGIPLEYLLKILQQMVRANILRSKRGPRGGFSLARPIKKINMLQIIEAVEGPMISQLDLKELAPKEKFGVKAEQIYEKALASARAVFEKAKISDIL
jgi:Rrf2 family protein